MRAIRSTTLLMTGAFIVGIGSAYAQDFTEPVVDSSQMTTLSPHSAVRDLQAAARQSGAFNHDINPAGAALKVFPYTVVSPRDGLTYSGNVVGASPFNHGARTTNIPTVLIPVRVQFTGTVRNFDPTSPDVGCLGAGHTALDLSTGSPIFTPVPNYTFNGVNEGNVTFVDGFQRAEFDSAPGFYAKILPNYHLGLSVTIAAKQTITVANGTSDGITITPNSPCSTNALLADNPPRWGVVNINTIDAALNAIITNLGLTRAQFPLFLIYGVVMSNGSALLFPNNCCILGYHNGAQILNTTDPEQTYGIAEYDRGDLFGAGTHDVSVLAHEVLEWANDPSTNNATPLWGGIGQVGGCQGNLEVGDPLSGTLMPGVTMPNGVTYHPQELAFFSWFLGGPFVGAGGKFSSNGTFGGDAKICPPGGTN